MNLDETKQGLRDRADSLARHLFPNGKLKGKEWLVGDVQGNASTKRNGRGSLGIVLQGEKVGAWRDHATGETGTLLDLWAMSGGYHGTEGWVVRAAEEAARWLGGEFEKSGGAQKPKSAAWRKASESTIPTALPCAQPSTAIEPPEIIVHNVVEWHAAVASFTDAEAEKVANARGISLSVFDWLRDRQLVGLVDGCVAFPVHDAGSVVAAHVRYRDSWRMKPGGKGTHPLVIGKIEEASQIWIIESQWDAISVLDRLQMHREDDWQGVAFFITRGASNGGLVERIAAEGKTLVLFPQNDAPDPKTGKVSSEEWVTKIIATIATKCKVLRVAIPSPFKDHNDWLRAHPEVDARALRAIIADARPARNSDRPLTSLMDIQKSADPAAPVLGADGYLRLCGSLLYVGPSGIGKSSSSVQQDALWGLGKAAFGIVPARPLRILTIQAENDNDDIVEMRDGVLRGLNLTLAEREIVRANVFYECENSLRGDEFLKFVDSRLALGKFDLLRIDPLMAYLPGDSKDAEVTAAFLRSGLNPILARHNVACIINHHTPKVNNRDTSNWRGSDWMYSGAGSADIVNWARAVLVIDPTHDPRIFRFIAAKRGGRIGWRDDSGEKQFDRYFCHARDGIYWQDATAEDLASLESRKAETRPSSRTVKTEADLLALVPLHGKIAKNVLIMDASAAGIGMCRTRTWLKQLIDTGILHEFDGPKRTRTLPEKFISRQPASLFADAA